MFIKVALKDLRAMFKERTFVSIIVLLLFIASFSSVITFGLLLMYNPTYFSYGNDAKIVYAGDCFTSECYEFGEAMEKLNVGAVDAVVFVRKGSDVVYVDLYLPEDDVRAIQTLAAVKKELLKYEELLRLENGVPVFSVKVYSDTGEIEVPEGASVVFKFIYLVLMPLIVITTAVVCAGLIIDSICEELENKTFEILMTTPLSTFEISLGKVFASIILATVLTSLWLGLLMVNGIEIYNAHLAFVASLATSFIFITLAYVFASVFRDRERSQLIFSILVVGLLPLLLSKSISPAVMVGRIAAGVDYNPIVPILVFVLSALIVLATPAIFPLRTGGR